MNRVRKIARQHTNGDAERHAHLVTQTSQVVDEAIVVTGPVVPVLNGRWGPPLGLVCDLTEDCTAYVTHEIPVRVDGRDAQVYGCQAHAVAWAAEANADAATEDDDGAE